MWRGVASGRLAESELNGKNIVLKHPNLGLSHINEKIVRSRKSSHQ
jgi:hypothetical protein